MTNFIKTACWAAGGFMLGLLISEALGGIGLLWSETAMGIKYLPLGLAGIGAVVSIVLAGLPQKQGEGSQ
ncbi:hypothetical protein SAMN02799630_01364 [Paenibacillus sp. UNCCL117]|uniref:DUF5957 family protein n=1 Tax=unclassified Paenibacillus TaxID=185978 RepID=UPI00088DE0D6|nr:MULTISPECIES: DUF5957 family protein [unclassified Paenibacillus]SDC74540.1 hypothetical protein SAMN04488602_103342 [Paenibacillus sp. cl123]SFW25250.1 hypothetical protein SAMN02799630_01364 [Paenibacillus sp. UNCCL117]